MPDLHKCCSPLLVVAAIMLSFIASFDVVVIPPLEGGVVQYSVSIASS